MHLAVSALNWYFPSYPEKHISLLSVRTYTKKMIMDSTENKNNVYVSVYVCEDFACKQDKHNLTKKNPKQWDQQYVTLNKEEMFEGCPCKISIKTTGTLTFEVDVFPFLFVIFFLLSNHRCMFKTGPFTRTILVPFIHTSTNWLEDSTFLSTLTILFKRNINKFIRDLPKNKVFVFNSFPWDRWAGDPASKATSGHIYLLCRFSTLSCCRKKRRKNLLSFL